MTVSATPRKAGPFAGTGAQTAFPFAFKIFATTDVVVTTVVTATSVQATPVNGVDYTVAMNADQENAPGGTVNMVVAPVAGVSLVISSAVPSTQSVAVQNNGGFFPAVFNAEFDKLTVLVQQLEENATRTLSSPITAAGVSGSITPVANAVLVWDGTGQNILSIPQTTLAASFVYNSATYQAALATSLAAVSADMIPDVDATRSIGSSAKRWLNLFISGVLSWGNSAAAPMLKRNGTGLMVRLGDDSSDAPLSASAFTSVLAQFFLGSFGSIKSSADGVLQLLNNAGTNFTRLCFGGTTIAFSALKPNGVQLKVRMADDSGDGDFSARDITTSGKVYLGGTSAANPAIKHTGAVLNSRLGDDSADADFTAARGTFSGQLIGGGTTTNNTAAAGQIGEYISSSVVQGSGVGLTNSAASNITSISLTAGDWDVWASGWFSPAGSTPTYLETNITVVSTGRPTAPNGGGTAALPVALSGAGSAGLSGARTRLSLAVTTTVYLTGFAIFPSGALTGWGSIQARRAW